MTASTVPMHHHLDAHESSWKCWRCEWMCQPGDRNCQQFTWKHLPSQWSCVGQATSALQPLLAPVNDSYYMWFNNVWNTCIQFLSSSMYGCIYIATCIYSRSSDRLQAGLEEILTCTCPCQSSQPVDGFCGHGPERLAIHLDAISMWPQRLSCSEVVDWLGKLALCKLGGLNWGSLRIHIAARSSQLWVSLRGHDGASLAIHWNAIPVQTWMPSSNDSRYMQQGCDETSEKMDLLDIIKWDLSGNWILLMNVMPGANKCLRIMYFTCNFRNRVSWLYYCVIMEYYLVAVDYTGRHTVSWRWIQGPTCNFVNEGNTDNLARILLYSVSAEFKVGCA